MPSSRSSSSHSSRSSSSRSSSSSSRSLEPSVKLFQLFFQSFFRFFLRPLRRTFEAFIRILCQPAFHKQPFLQLFRLCKKTRNGRKPRNQCQCANLPPAAQSAEKLSGIGSDAVRMSSSRLCVLSGCLGKRRNQLCGGLL